MKLRIVLVAVAVLAATGAVLADTLVLTNGRRIDGELIGVYGQEIEFEQRTGGRRQIIRVPRRDIVRVEFNDGPVVGGRPELELERGIPRGMRERQINVTAREPWVDTGIDLRAGQVIYFSASGEVRWGPNRRDGAAGERNSPRNPNRPLPDRPAAALIGRVGTGNDVFFIGDQTGPFRVRNSGRLFLGINDDVFGDNTGSFRVTVAY